MNNGINSFRQKRIQSTQLSRGIGADIVFFDDMIGHFNPYSTGEYIPTAWQRFGVNGITTKVLTTSDGFGVMQVNDNGGSLGITTGVRQITFGGGKNRYFACKCKIINLAVAANYRLQTGFLDSAVITPQDGAYFEYTTDGSGSVWRCKTANNSVITTTTTSSAVVANQWYILEIFVTDNTSAKFYVDGNHIATHVTNIPSNVLRTFGLGYGHVRTTGASISNLDRIYATRG